METTRHKKEGERTRAQWEDLVPQAREWLDEQNPVTQVNIPDSSNLSSMATGIFLVHPQNLWKVLEMGSCAASRTWLRGPSERNVPWIDLSGQVPDTGAQRQGLTQDGKSGTTVSLIQLGSTRIVKALKVVDLACVKKRLSSQSITCKSSG